MVLAHSPEVVVKLSGGLQASEGLTGAGGPASERARSRGWWQVASVPRHGVA